MSYRQRPHDLRLAIAFEAEALMSDFGGKAYAYARRRAKEVSSDFLARDWSEVALMIARKMGKRSSLLAGCFVSLGARQLGSLFRNFVGAFGPWASGASLRTGHLWPFAALPARSVSAGARARNCKACANGRSDQCGAWIRSADVQQKMLF